MILATSCGNQVVEAQLIPKPVDIILTIDNSGSMGEEILGVQNNINNNFAQLIADSGVDFRVVLVSLFGSDGTKVCIDPPLAGATCAAGLQASTSDVFFHYNLEIDSANSLCQLLVAFDRPGFGYSSQPADRRWTAHAQADVIAAALRHLGLARAIVVGHSWGTLVGIALAERHPQLVRGLVLASGYYHPSVRMDVALLSPPALPVVGRLMRWTVSPSGWSGTAASHLCWGSRWRCSTCSTCCATANPTSPCVTCRPHRVSPSRSPRTMTRTASAPRLPTFARIRWSTG